MDRLRLEWETRRWAVIAAGVVAVALLAALSLMIAGGGDEPGDAGVLAQTDGGSRAALGADDDQVSDSTQPKGTPDKLPPLSPQPKIEQPKGTPDDLPALSPQPDAEQPPNTNPEPPTGRTVEPDLPRDGGKKNPPVVKDTGKKNVPPSKDKDDRRRR